MLVSRNPFSDQFLVETLPKRLRTILVARVLLFFAAALLVSGFLVAPALRWSFSFSTRLAVLSWAAVALTSALIEWSVRRKRRSMELALLLLVLDQALWTLFVYLSGGALSGATSLYGVTCLTGGMLLGISGILTAALAGGVFFSLMVLLLESGIVEPPWDQWGYTYELASRQTSVSFIINLLVLVLVALLASYLVERLKKTSGALVEAERRAVHAERLAVLGQLASGLAHEIRNPLSSIASATQMLRDGVSAEDRVLCDIVTREAMRLEDLASDMMSLSKPRLLQKKLVDVAQIVEEVVALASRSGRGGEDVRVLRLGDAGPLWAEVDAAQFRQLVWNLVRNAVQASSAQGEVRVRLLGGERRELRVEDEGQGIEPEARERIFDALFTTRSQGSGVGLAVVQRIATDHGFQVRVESEPGAGAQFIVDLGEEPQKQD